MSTAPLVTLSSLPPGRKSFVDRVNDLMARVTHGCAYNEKDLELVFKTRYQAYRRQNKINDIDAEMIYDDKYDEQPNCYIIMTYIDDEFISTFRIHWAKNFSQRLPSQAVFSDLIDPYLREGSVVIDPTRLAARFDASRRYPELPFLALRPAWLAAVHLEADVVLATVAAEHAAFYKRVFGYEALCSPRAYPLLLFPVVCMALNFQQARSNVESSYPFFKSTERERDILFGPSPTASHCKSGFDPHARRLANGS